MAEVAGSQWSPIETVPKDGRLVDLWCMYEGGLVAGRYADCRWGSVDQEDIWLDGNDYCLNNHGVAPTHWMRVSPPEDVK